MKCIFLLFNYAEMKKSKENIESFVKASKKIGVIYITALSIFFALQKEVSAQQKKFNKPISTNTEEIYKSSQKEDLKKINQTNKPEFHIFVENEVAEQKEVNESFFNFRDLYDKAIKDLKINEQESKDLSEKLMRINASLTKLKELNNSSLLDEIDMYESIYNDLVKQVALLNEDDVRIFKELEKTLESMMLTSSESLTGLSLQPIIKPEDIPEYIESKSNYNKAIQRKLELESSTGNFSMTKSRLYNFENIFLKSINYKYGVNELQGLENLYNLIKDWKIGKEVPIISSFMNGEKTKEIAISIAKKDKTSFKKLVGNLKSDISNYQIKQEQFKKDKIDIISMETELQKLKGEGEGSIYNLEKVMNSIKKEKIDLPNGEIPKKNGETYDKGIKQEINSKLSTVNGNIKNLKLENIENVIQALKFEYTNKKKCFMNGLDLSYEIEIEGKKVTISEYLGYVESQLSVIKSSIQYLEAKKEYEELQKKLSEKDKLYMEKEIKKEKEYNNFSNNVGQTPDEISSPEEYILDKKEYEGIPNLYSETLHKYQVMIVAKNKMEKSIENTESLPYVLLELKSHNQ